MKTVRILALVTAAAVYLLIVLGGIVRITGSGMGCGDDWPLCNGRIIPPLDDIATLIEYAHRMLAALVGVLVAALPLAAWRHRGAGGGTGAGSVFRPALLALLLVILVAMLGRATVMLELPPSTVVLHLSTAMALIATVVVIALRAGEPGPPASPSEPRLWRGAVVALALGAVAVLLGGLTANLGAAGACLGFPLCSGQLWPADAGAGAGLAHVHWMHRLVAYALTLHIVGMVIRCRRRGAHPMVMAAGWLALGITVLQVIVAAAMVLTVLQPHWRAFHVAAGTAVWLALVILAWYARRFGSEVTRPAASAA